MTVLLGWVIKSTLILGIALLMAALSRGRSAAFRHFVLAAGIASALALPPLFLVSPGWEIPAGSVAVAGRPAGPSPQVIPPAAFRLPAAIRRGSGAVTSAAVGLAPVAKAFPFVWAAGAALLAGALGLGLIRLRQLERAASIEVSPEWAALLREAASRMQIRRPVRLLFSATHNLPVTWGARSPRILLPTSAADWPEDRKRIVLLHELAHVARADWTAHIAATALRAALWFNPLAWIARRRLSQESEIACDDRVLSAGVAGADYASQLLELARALEGRAGRHLPAPAIVETTHFERRVRAMLNPATDRAPVSRRMRRVLLFAAASMAISVAGGTAAQTFATFAGSVVDPTNAVVPRVTFVLTNEETGTKHEINSGQDGRVELSGLAPGMYGIEANRPGFAPLTLRVRMQDGQRLEPPALVMQVGELQETVTITDNPGEHRALARSMPRRTPQCDAAAAEVADRVGGSIRPPRMINHVPPDYPANLSGSGKSGAVELRGRVSGDGRMEGLVVVGDADPDLAASALAAVNQWEYDGTLLNCQPWPVNISVHLQYSGTR